MVGSVNTSGTFKSASTSRSSESISQSEAASVGPNVKSDEAQALAGLALAAPMKAGLLDPGHTSPLTTAHTKLENTLSLDSTETRSSEELQSPNNLTQHSKDELAECAVKSLKRNLIGQAHIKAAVQAVVNDVLASLPEGIDTDPSQLKIQLKSAAIRVFGRLGHESHFQQFTTLRAKLGELKIKHVYSPGTGSLGDTLIYLANDGKKAFNKLNLPNAARLEGVDQQAFQALSSLDKEPGQAKYCAVILDQPLIKQLKTDTNLLQQVIRSQAVLLLPSEVADIDPLTAQTPQELQAPVKKIIFNALSPNNPQALTDLVQPKGLTQTIAASFTDAYIAELHQELPGLGDIHIAAPAEKVDKKTQQIAQKTEIEIAENFNPGVNLKAKAIQKELNQKYTSNKPMSRYGGQSQVLPNEMSDESMKLLLEFVNQQSQVFSPAQLIDLAKQQKINVETIAQEQWNVAPKDLTVVVCEPQKSFAMTAAIFQRANPDFEGRFISMVDFKNNVASMDTTQGAVVVLDDLSGSGKSLDRILLDMRQKYAYSGPLIFSTLLSTQSAIQATSQPSNKDNELTRPTPENKAPQMFTGFRQRESVDPKFAFTASKTIDSVHTSKFYQSLSEEDQIQLGIAAGGWGWGGQGLMIVFPYMSPNNNAVLPASALASSFTLNQSGVKTRIQS